MAKTSRRRPMSEINVVPYIDVMLVLLVIFMVTAPLMTQGIKVVLPEANSEAIAIDDPNQMLVISINACTQQAALASTSTTVVRTPSGLTSVLPLMNATHKLRK